MGHPFDQMLLFIRKMHLIRSDSGPSDPSVISDENGTVAPIKNGTASDYCHDSEMKVSASCEVTADMLEWYLTKIRQMEIGITTEMVS